MNQIFNFAKSTVSLSIPDRSLRKVLTAKAVEVPPDQEETVRRAIAAPIGTPRLSEIVRPGEKIAIITSDITRPMPSRIVLPPVLAELEKAGIAPGDVTIVFALGIHRTHTEAEKEALVGSDVYRKYRCIDSSGEFVKLGTGKHGTPFEVFKPVVDADRRICLGNIEFHYFAGFSGGMKAIMPGVSTKAAIQANHSHMVHPDAAAGKIDGNPVRGDIDEVLDFINVDFIVNVVLDEKKRIVHAVAGHPIAAHRAGCRLLEDMYRIEIPDRAEIVVVSPGGYPKDINLYQAQKALDNAKHAVRKGGSILWIASAAEGLGEDSFEEWMLGHEKLSDMIPHIREHFVLGGHKAAAIALVAEIADIYLYSDLPEDFVRRLHFQPVSDLQGTFDALLRKYGENAGVIAMPFGGATLPFLAGRWDAG